MLVAHTNKHKYMFSVICTKFPIRWEKCKNINEKTLRCEGLSWYWSRAFAPMWRSPATRLSRVPLPFIFHPARHPNQQQALRLPLKCLLSLFTLHLAAIPISLQPKTRFQSCFIRPLVWRCSSSKALFTSRHLRKLPRE